MVRKLHSSNFQETKSYLAKQVGELSTITQSISSAISAECGTEFNNGFMKTKYSEISTLLNSRKNAIIEQQITLGKKSVYISKDDENASSSLEGVLGEIESKDSALSAMKNSIVSSVASMNCGTATIDDLIDVLPPERAKQIKEGDIFISSDCQYLYYNGYAYEIVNPYAQSNNSVGPTISARHEWTTVHEKIYDKTTWNWSGALAGLSNMSSDDMAAATVDIQGKPFNIMDGAFSILNFIASAREDVSVTVNFQENEIGERRVMIGVINSEYQDVIEQYAGTSHSWLDSCGDGAAQILVSNGVEQYYTEMTGNETNRWHEYDVVATLDERHKDDTYTSFISFDSDGTMQETVRIYDGDSMVIQERQGFLNFDREDIYEIEINDTSNVPDEYKEAFLQGLGEGFN